MALVLGQKSKQGVTIVWILCTSHYVYWKWWSVGTVQYIVHTMYSVHGVETVLYVHCTYSTLYNVHCTMYSIHCTVYNVEYVQCTLYTVQCTVYM